MVYSLAAAGLQVDPRSRRVAALMSHLAGGEGGAKIALVCRAFDEAVEFAALEGRTAFDAASEFLAEDWGPAQEELRRLVPLGDPVETPELPVLPESARRLILANASDISLAELVRIAQSDSILRSHLLRAANHRRLANERQIVRPRDAVARIGFPDAWQTLVAACLSDLFPPVQWQDFWSHSRLVASIASDLARLTQVDAGMAYLSGLLHDIGRLGFLRVSAARQEMARKWRDSGFPASYAEMLAYGDEHAGFGARWIRAWDLPDEVLEAVEQHHRPESTASILASTLCLAEDIAAQINAAESEDLWPVLRRQLACRNAGIEIGDLDAVIERHSRLLVHCA